MKIPRTTPPGVRCLFAGALALPLLAGAAYADPPTAGTQGAGPRFGACDTGFRDDPPRHPGPAGPPGMPPPMGFDDARPPPFLMGLTLTDEQQDKVFAIVHNAAPALRDQSKVVRKARDALHELTRAARFNDATATTLAQAQGKAEGQLALLRTRMEREVFAVLTVEQQTQVTTREHGWELHRDSGPGFRP